MSGLEINKICAAILVAGLIAMITGAVADGLYRPAKHLEKRGFEVEGASEEASAGGAVADAGPVDILTFMAAADAAKGEVQSKKCTSCHTFDKGGADKQGPNLWNVLGGPVAHSANFAYSPAMLEHKGKHKWGFQELSEFIANPKKYVSGTRMAFAGIKKPEDRANLIAYLRTLSDSPIAVPAAKPAAAPTQEPEKSADAEKGEKPATDAKDSAAPAH